MKDYSEPYRRELDRMNASADAEIFTAFVCGFALALMLAIGFLQI